MTPNSPFSSALRKVNPNLPLDRLKVCPLCGSVNSRKNHECFVCRWQGEFETDPDVLMTGLHEIVLQCPSIIDIIAREPEERLSLLTRLMAALRKKGRTRRPLDLSA